MTPPLEGVVEKKKAAVVGETTAAFFFGTRQYVVSPGLQKRGFSFTMETTNNPKGSITKMQRGDTTWKL